MTKIDYKTAGVDIEKADMLTAFIKNTVVSENIGAFAGLYETPFIPEYYLVSCTDGVGTKVIPLIEREEYETIATDLVAMNVNDLICVGAKPLFFLDYFATSKLDVEVTSKFIKALKEVLSGFNCTLLGGETAELNDLIAPNHFDVGGFVVGIVKKDKVLKKDNVNNGDLVIGLKSSGPHSNGYTLIRKLFEKGLLTESDMEQALKPTHIYVNEIIKLTDTNQLKVCANITGGGLAGNLERVIPEGLCAEIFRKNIPAQPIFEKLESLVGQEEAYKTFNMGVGLCIIANPENKDEIFKTCAKYEPFILGNIVADSEQKVVLE